MDAIFIPSNTYIFYAFLYMSGFMKTVLKSSVYLYIYLFISVLAMPVYVT